MTLADLKEIDEPTISPAVAANILHCNPQWIRIAAREDKARLGFPVIVLNKRVRIPRLPFIKFLEEGVLYDQRRAPLLAPAED